MTFVGLSGTFAFAELPMTEDPVLREAHHAETHSEPSDEELERIASMPRRAAVTDDGPTASVSVGYPNRGVLRYGVRINDDRALRIKEGSRSTRHGTGELVRLIEYAAHEVAFQYPRARLTVGDLSRTHGGRFHPHKSHQSGRDVDLGFYMLNRRKKPINVHRFIYFNREGLGRQWGQLYRFDDERNWALIESLLSHPSVDIQHIFVTNTIKRRLVRHAVRTKVDPRIIMRAKRVISQPRHGAPHRTHFHVRIFCALDDLPLCKDRPPFYAWHERPTKAPAFTERRPDDS